MYCYKEFIKLNENIFIPDDISDILNIASDQGYLVKVKFGSDRNWNHTRKTDREITIENKDVGDISKNLDFINMVKNIHDRINGDYDINSSHISTLAEGRKYIPKQPGVVTINMLTNNSMKNFTEYALSIIDTNIFGYFVDIKL